MEPNHATTVKKRKHFNKNKSKTDYWIQRYLESTKPFDDENFYQSTHDQISSTSRPTAAGVTPKGKTIKNTDNKNLIDADENHKDIFNGEKANEAGMIQSDDEEEEINKSSRELEKAKDEEEKRLIQVLNELQILEGASEVDDESHSRRSGLLKSDNYGNNDPSMVKTKRDWALHHLHHYFKEANKHGSALCKLYIKHEEIVEKMVASYMHENLQPVHKAFRKYCGLKKISKKDLEEAVVEHLAWINDELEKSKEVVTPSLVEELEDVGEDELGDVVEEEEEEEEIPSQIEFHPENLNLILFPPSSDSKNRVLEIGEGLTFEKMSVDDFKERLWDDKNDKRKVERKGLDNKLKADRIKPKPYLLDRRRKNIHRRRPERAKNPRRERNRSKRKYSTEHDKKVGELTELAELINDFSKNSTLAKSKEVKKDRGSEISGSGEECTHEDEKEATFTCHDQTSHHHHEILRLPPVDRNLPEEVINVEFSGSKALWTVFPIGILLFLLMGAVGYWWYRRRKRPEVRKSSYRRPTRTSRDWREDEAEAPTTESEGEEEFDGFSRTSVPPQTPPLIDKGQKQSRSKSYQEDLRASKVGKKTKNIFKKKKRDTPRESNPEKWRYSTQQARP